MNAFFVCDVGMENTQERTEKKKTRMNEEIIGGKERRILVSLNV